MAGVRRFDERMVLGAIMTAFWARGFEATSIEDLERATGLKRQSLYNAFGAKPAMYRRALDHYAAAVATPIRDALDHPDPQVALRRFFDLQVERPLVGDRPGGCFEVVACHEHGGRDDDLGRRVAADLRGSEALLATTLESWRAAGALRPEAEPRRLARFLVALTRGISGIHRATGDRAAMRDAAAIGVDAIRPWLAAPPAGSAGHVP